MGGRRRCSGSRRAGDVLRADRGAGSKLTYVGSLATLLWRRVLAGTGAAPALPEFTRLGVLTVPASLVASVLGRWAALQVGGG